MKILFCQWKHKIMGQFHVFCIRVSERKNLLTELTWPNEYDRTMTTTNLNNWIWPKLTLTNLLKPTNLNFTSGVLLISVPDIFFLVEERSEAADRTSIFFWRPVNVRRCREIRSNSENNVCRCDHFSVIL